MIWKGAYPLPRGDETLDTLEWFSIVDLISGYWQVEVSPEDWEKTAFTTPSDLFKFKDQVMPLGLCHLSMANESAKILCWQAYCTLARDPIDS